MKIANASSYDVAERMGDDISEREGRIMLCKLINEGYGDSHFGGVPESVWFKLLDETADEYRRECDE